MSYNPNKTPRLNNFILWCKGWYNPTYDEMNEFDMAKLALELDEYICCRSNADVLTIVTNFIDEFNEYRISTNKAHLTHRLLLDGMYRYMRYGFSYDESILLTYRDFLAFDCTNKDIALQPPVYSKKLRKKGFVHENKIGLTYKQANNYAKKFFQKISTK